MFKLRSIRRKSLRLTALFLSLFLLTLCGCSRSEDYSRVPEGNAMYYWRTSLALDSAETTFLRKYDVRRLYVRFFDVVKEKGTSPTPNATLRFPEGNVIPRDVESIPVVFVTPECLTDTSELPGLAERIFRRVTQIAETNELSSPKELQIDCDWTPSTRKAFFSLMQRMLTLAHDSGMMLSATIRLHQLSSAPPPADYGVLMVYNTGDLMNPSKGNPILSFDAVKPFLRYLSGFRLPLVAAYPNFRWPALYKETRTPDGRISEEFEGILYGCDPEKETSLFRKSGPGEWTAISSMRMQTAIGNTDGVVRVIPGMKLRLFTPPPLDELLKIKQALAHRLPHINQCVILYDLNSENITVYDNHYEKIFAH